MRFHGKEPAAAAFAALDKLMLTAPVQLSGFLGITNQRTLGTSQSTAARRSIFPELSIDGSNIGPAGELRDLLGPVASAASPAACIVGEFEYWTRRIEWPQYLISPSTDSPRQPDLPMPLSPQRRSTRSWAE